MQRSGQSAATMSAVRAPQSKPATIASVDLEGIHQRDRVDGEGRLLAVPRASSLERNRVVP